MRIIALREISATILNNSASLDESLERNFSKFINKLQTTIKQICKWKINEPFSLFASVSLLSLWIYNWSLLRRWIYCNTFGSNIMNYSFISYKNRINVALFKLFDILAIIWHICCGNAWPVQLINKNVIIHLFKLLNLRKFSWLFWNFDTMLHLNSTYFYVFFLRTRITMPYIKL